MGVAEQGHVGLALPGGVFQPCGGQLHLVAVPVAVEKQQPVKGDQALKGLAAAEIAVAPGQVYPQLGIFAHHLVGVGKAVSQKDHVGGPGLGFHHPEQGLGVAVAVGYDQQLFHGESSSSGSRHSR